MILDKLDSMLISITVVKIAIDAFFILLFNSNCFVNSFIKE